MQTPDTQMPGLASLPSQSSLQLQALPGAIVELQVTTVKWQESWQLNVPPE
jgi:hypothetical protein